MPLRSPYLGVRYGGEVHIESLIMTDMTSLCNAIELYGDRLKHAAQFLL